jgi:hypothetical protein
MARTTEAHQVLVDVLVTQSFIANVVDVSDISVEAPLADILRSSDDFLALQLPSAGRHVGPVVNLRRHKNLP